MRSLLFALLLVSAIGQVQGQSHSTDPKEKGDSNAQIAQPPHVGIDLVNSRKSMREVADEPEKENREELHKNIELYLTSAIVLAAIAQAFFAFLQWRIYGLQLKTSMPLVIIDWENFIHLSPPDPNIDSGPVAHHFNWGIRNIGPTPAFIVGTSARFVIVPADRGIPKIDYADLEPYIGEPLPTEPKPVEGGMPFYVRLADTRTYEEIELAIRSGKERLYAFGYVRFRDRYGKKHISRFCLRYWAWETMRRDFDGFGIEGIKQNKYS